MATKAQIERMAKRIGRPADKTGRAQSGLGYAVWLRVSPAEAARATAGMPERERHTDFRGVGYRSWGDETGPGWTAMVFRTGDTLSLGVHGVATEG